MSQRTVTVVLAQATGSETTATALKLSERLLARGARVRVFAHGDAAAVAAGNGEVAGAVAALLRRGVHGAGLAWVVDADDAQRLSVADRQAAGVVLGDAADLWAFVREADVVLSPAAAR